MRIVVVMSDQKQETQYANVFLQALRIKAAKENHPVYTHQEMLNMDTPANALILVQPQENSLVKSWYWKNVQLPSLIKKIKADVLIWMEECISNRFSIQQYVLLNDVESLNKKTAAALKSYQIITPDPHTSSLLIQEWEMKADQIITATLFVSDKVKPLNEEEKTSIKDQLSEGKEFFYAAVHPLDDEHFLHLLKAFSVFKKWQLSSMKLVVKTTLSAAATEKLSTYKFRNDVVVVQDDEPVPACYAAVLMYAKGSDYTGVSALLQYEVPVIASDNEHFKTVYGENIHYAAVDTEKSLGTAMVELYRNETLRNQLAAKAKTFSTTAEKNNSMQQLWARLQKA